jgi:hypothetical protein
MAERAFVMVPLAELGVEIQATVSSHSLRRVNDTLSPM